MVSRGSMNHLLLHHAFDEAVGQAMLSVSAIEWIIPVDMEQLMGGAIIPFLIKSKSSEVRWWKVR